MAADFNFGFSEGRAVFESASQSARVWTEDWVGREMYCPACGEKSLRQKPKNLPVADFDCEACENDFELKSSSKPFGKKVVDGAYRTMIDRLTSDTVPNLILLTYDRSASSVTDLSVVPGRFFVPKIIERRKPLAPTARRAGWEGCNILLDQIPRLGFVNVIAGQKATPRLDVLKAWAATTFLERRNLQSRGWLNSVLQCVERVAVPDFSLADIYSFELELAKEYPGNNNIRPKIRQQLQVLRDNGIVEFVGNGFYRLI